MNNEVFNIYIEKLTTMVSELTKSNILQSAQISYYEKNFPLLNNKIDELQKSLDEALNKVDSKSKKSDTVTF
jgi:hypothetical protein